ncbi:hypothetical protein O2W14_01035 [Modestobacter sp. VKM Ac-2986]|uniref:LGFP repeat-containing protein n=1 Tax=Modestobacter sp. VKM Ac-2986 TaxID=3004140 RepID=UPI0022AA1D96|nr:hypothetical protein [Modestobacter sp. VKM Ac-2986]MCZ2827416.1 hypothetical protein [Modestobacter sp. VKM Ac-2986]
MSVPTGLRRRRWSWAVAAAAVVGVLCGTPGVASAADDNEPARVAVAAKYAALGGPSGTLGAAVGSLSCDGLDYAYRCVQDYERGAISWARLGGTYAVTDPAVFARWAASGAEPAYRTIGQPTADTFCGLAGGGCGQHFERGSIYWSPPVGRALLVDEEARDDWRVLGWERGPMGFPVTEEECTLREDGCIQRFTGGAVYSSSDPYVTSAVVAGPVADRWAAQGWERGPLGYPTSSTFCGLRGGGCGQHFRGGSVYSTPAGTFVVDGARRELWAAQGWENGALGYPTSGAFRTQSWGDGQHFEGGSIYASVGQTIVVPDPIRAKWGSLGWERSVLNTPTTPAFCGLRDGGCGQHFMGGSVYTSRSGTFTVMLPFRDRWAAEGWENGRLGYPTSDKFEGLYTRGQAFQGGTVYTYNGNLHLVPSSLLGAYAAQGWERGGLGLPTSEAFCGLRNGGCGQHFRGGSIYTRAAGAGGVAVPTVIERAWAASGWESGRYGYPIGAAYAVPNGTAQAFEGGVLTVG